MNSVKEVLRNRGVGLGRMAVGKGGNEEPSWLKKSQKGLPKKLVVPLVFNRRRKGNGRCATRNLQANKKTKTTEKNGENHRGFGLDLVSAAPKVDQRGGAGPQLGSGHDFMGA